MENRLIGLLEKLNDLEKEIFFEIEKKQDEFSYTIRKKRIKFEREIKKKHRLLIKKLRYYLRDAAFLNILTAPIIWSCLFPALFMDLVISFYQFVCFPIYRIPKVRRGDYIVIDRHFLSYLNAIERMNCLYCGYFNGLMGYAREIAARTEQYWCPIKHARRTRSIHSRYKKFFEYGDAQNYRESIEEVRRNFKDLN